MLVTARPVMTSSATGSDWLEVVRWRRTPEWTPQLAKVRDLAEEICHVLKTNRPALHGKFSIRSVA